MRGRTTIQVSEETRKKLKVLAAGRDESYQKILEDMIDVFTELDRDKAIISIPEKLAATTRKKIKKTDFKTVSEYVTFLLRIMLYEQAGGGKPDVEKVRARLEKLGYISKK